MSVRYIRLCERAAINRIDMCGYLNYHPAVMREILIALELGCTKRQIQSAMEVAGPKYFRKSVQNYIGVPDYDSYIDILSDATTEQKALPDVRNEMKKWDLLLPSDKVYGWCSKKKGMTIKAVQAYLDANEPEFGELFPYFLAADHFIASNKKISFLLCLKEAVEMIGIKYDDKLLSPALDVSEALAVYLAAAGKSKHETMLLCGEILREFRLEPREAYQCLLDSVAFSNTALNGGAAGAVLLAQKSMPIKYRIIETGIFKKLYLAEPISPSIPLIYPIAQAMRKSPGQEFEALYMLAAGRKSVIVQQAILKAGVYSETIDSFLTLDKPKEQYVKELLAFYC